MLAVVNKIDRGFVVLTCTSSSNPGRYDNGTGWNGLSYGDVWNSRTMFGPLLTMSGTESPPHSRTRMGDSLFDPS